MSFRLFQRREILWPTLLGWLTMVGAVLIAGFLWVWRGEAFFRLTERLPPDILVVEGWIGPEGVRAAAQEFLRGGYRYVVASGGYSDTRWTDAQWSFTHEAAKQLRLAGIPDDRILLAPPALTSNQRTFEAARAVWARIAPLSPPPTNINVFTLGAHARRSRLIFSEVLPVPVGVISWTPRNYGDARWWHSSARAEDMLKETVGYLYEVLLRSGRGFGTPLPATPSSP